MRLWEKVTGALKDHNSLWLANATPRTTLRNPDIEKAVIRATAHNGLTFNHRCINRVREWLAVSPMNLKALLWAISNRMEKSGNWVVAMKGLYLMHVLATTKIPGVKKIGRLPFDLSGFKDGHSRRAKAWHLNDFVRVYYAFLDQKSVVVFQNAEEKKPVEGGLIMQELVFLQKFQGLIDLLMQIKPQGMAAFVPLILDIMDGVVVEIYDLYSRVCRGIAVVLMNIYSTGRADATMALNVVLKATQQCDDLISYFEFCREIGVVKASEFPVIDRIPEDGIQELRQIIEGLSDGCCSGETNVKDSVEKQIVVREAAATATATATAVKETDEGKKYFNGERFRTIITDKWEKFDEDFGPNNPFAGPLITFVKETKRVQELPDLIIL